MVPSPRGRLGGLFIADWYQFSDIRLGQKRRSRHPLTIKITGHEAPPAALPCREKLKKKRNSSTPKGSWLSDTPMCSANFYQPWIEHSQMASFRRACHPSIQSEAHSRQLLRQMFHWCARVRIAVGDSAPLILR